MACHYRSLKFGFKSFWGCLQLTEVSIYSSKEQSYENSQMCFYDKQQIENGTLFNQSSFSPFECGTDSLTNISVPFDYKGETFLGKPIQRRTEEEDKLIEGN